MATIEERLDALRKGDILLTRWMELEQPLGKQALLLPVVLAIALAQRA